MPFLVGILLDVSNSMKCVFEKFDDKDRIQSRSIFSVVNDIVGKSVSFGNDVFAIGFGAKNASNEFDILGSLQSFRETYDNEVDPQVFQETLDKISIHNDLLSQVTKSFINPIKERVPFYILKLISEGLNESEELRMKLKETTFSTPEILDCIASIYEGKIPEKIKEIKTVVLQDKHVREMLLQNEIRTFDFAVAIDILRYWIEDKMLSDHKIRSIMRNVGPFIYGHSCLFHTLQKSVGIFANTKYVNHEKFLFVLSTGGQITQKTLLEEIAKAKTSTRDKKITIVSLYISGSKEKAISRARTLFGSVKEDWDTGARALFNLSSGVTTKLLPHAIFHARKWNIETTNNEIKLFLQINDPDLIQEACNLASEVVGSQDALLGILGNISLAEYIKSTNDAFTAQSQVGGTCYANATAAVLHLAMKRVVHRTGGYPKFDDIRKTLIKKHGIEGALMAQVLSGICPEFRLHWRNVKVDDAMDAISKGRSLIAVFYLTKDEWAIFSNFFNNHPNSVLTKNELDIDKRLQSSKLEGHAVVLTSFNIEGFRFMNSWGATWGDLGFFRVKNERVLGITFIDVFWYEEELFEKEKKFFEKHGGSLAKELLKRFVDLTEKTYKCPECFSVSKVNEFTGTLAEACCPKCYRTFKCSDDIVMNLYLSSILRKP